MEDLLYDYHIAQAMANLDNQDEKQRAFNQTLYFAAVLEKHGVTKAEFDSSLVYYYIRADRFGEMYKSLAKRLSDDALELGASEGEVNRYAKLNASGDTTDVWTGQLSAMLIPYPPYNRIDFEQKADTSFRKGDSFMFILNTDYIYQNGSHFANACIVMKYDNDTIVSRTASLTSSGINQIRVPENGNHKVKEIRGFIYLAPETEVTTTLKLMAVKNIQLIKFRKKEKKEEQPKDSAAVGKVSKDSTVVRSIPKDSLGKRKIQPIALPKVKDV